MPLKAGDGPYVARLRVRQPSRVRILQMTDLHFFAGKDPVFGLLNPQTTKIMEQLVRLADPDVVIITGDLWRDSPEPRREEFMQFAVEQCEALGVPWAFTWGNHDQLNDYAVAHRRLCARHGRNLVDRKELTGNSDVNRSDPQGATVRRSRK